MQTIKRIARLSLTALLILSLMASLMVSVNAAEPESEKIQTFTDVPQGHVYAKAIQWATASGIMQGYEDGTFRPENPLTRAELYRTLANVCMAPQWDGSENEHWAQSAIDYMTGKGFVAPTTEPAGGPHYTEKVTRAEAFHVIYAVLQTMGVSPKKDANPVIMDQASIPAEYVENVRLAYQSGIVSLPGTNFYPNGLLDRGELARTLYNASFAVDLPTVPILDNEPVTATVYTLTDKGEFERTRSTGQVATMKGNTAYYNLTDCAKLAGVNLTIDLDSISSTFYHVNGEGQKVYNVPAIVVTCGNYVAELAEGYITVKSGERALGTTEAQYTVKDEALYLTAQNLRYVLNAAVVDSEGNLNVLNRANGKLPAFIAESKVNDIGKDHLLAATWLVYNLYRDGYQIVLSDVKTVKGMGKADMARVTANGKADGAAATVGYAKVGSNNTVYLLNNLLDGATIDRLATILVHEATHYQEFAHGNLKEDLPVMEQVKAAYALYKAGSNVFKTAYDCYQVYTTTDPTDPYYEGGRLAAEWVSSQK